jgi:type IV secretory pathway VirB2 component (pilin)
MYGHMATAATGAGGALAFSGFRVAGLVVLGIGLAFAGTATLTSFRRRPHRP